MINWLQGVIDSDEIWHELVGEMIFGETITLLHLLIIPANFLQVVHQVWGVTHEGLRMVIVIS